MTHTITVFEKYSRHWPMTTIISGVLSVILFGLFLFTDNTLAGGYLRLGAFASFAVCLLSYFKIRDGQIKLDLSIDNSKNLLIDYFMKDQIIYKESFSLNEIQELKMDRVPNKSFYNDLFTGDFRVLYKKSDYENFLNLTEIRGRLVPLEEENALHIISFIEHHKK
jgi:hypothetical protein